MILVVVCDIAIVVVIITERQGGCIVLYCSVLTFPPTVY